MNVATAVVLVITVVSVTGAIVLVAAIRGVVESIRIRHNKDNPVR